MSFFTNHIPANERLTKAARISRTLPIGRIDALDMWSGQYVDAGGAAGRQ